MAYIGNSPGVASQRVVSTFTATANQTTFTPISGYTLGYVEVYQNGLLLVEGTDYTAADGQDIILTQGANLDDDVHIVAYLPRGLSDGYTKAEADARFEPIDSAYTKAEADARFMDINEETLPSQTGQTGKYLTTDGTTASWGEITDPTPAAVSSQDNTATDFFDLPSGTTAQRPSSPNAGYTRFNTDFSSIEFFDGSSWIATNLIPTLTSVTGDITKGTAGNLTLSGTNFVYPNDITVTFTVGGADYTVSVTPTDDSTATVSIPAGVYNSAIGSTVAIKVENTNGNTSGVINKTVQARTAVLSSVSGDIIKATSGTLSLTGSGFANNNLVVNFVVNAVDVDVTVTPASDTSATVSIPSSVYNEAVGSSVSVKVTNEDGSESGVQTKNVQARPITLSSVSGDIYQGNATTLTLSGSGFSATPITVTFNGANSTTLSVSNDTSGTVPVPSAVYNQSAGTTITIAVSNVDGTTASNTVNKTVTALPSGGSISTSGGYRYHTFTSSGTFSNTIPSLNVEYLVVAGGGAGGTGGSHGGTNEGTGGGGAGGAIDSSKTLSTGNKSVVVGGGGGTSGERTAGGNGGNSSFDGVTAIGGGGGAGPSGSSSASAPKSGGSGGGGGGVDTGGYWPGGGPGGASGTSGQGNAGGSAVNGACGGGGGGKTSTGGNAPNNSTGGNGGNGINWKSLGTTYAGGGGGAGSASSGGGSGAAGGGNGRSASGGPGGNAAANRGSGGGGALSLANQGIGYGGSGGSGIVIIRYQI